MTGKPNQASRTVLLTPRGHWQAARIKLLARLGARCQVQPDSPEFVPMTYERLEF